MDAMDHLHAYDSPIETKMDTEEKSNAFRYLQNTHHDSESDDETFETATEKAERKFNEEKVQSDYKFSSSSELLLGILGI
jgi:hypothetical protein